MEHWGQADYTGTLAGQNMAGQRQKYDLLTYVWSDIFDLHLEFAGLEKEFDRIIVRGEPSPAGFSVLYLSGNVMTAHFSINVKKKVREHLIDRGFDEKFGARPLRRLLQKEVEDPLSLEILKGRFTAGDAIDIEMRGDKILFRKQETRKALKAPDQPAGLLMDEKEAEKVTT